MNENESINSDDFMSFFRNDEKLSTLTNDDRVEVFSQILSGGSFLSKNLLESILIDYSQDTLQVIEIKI